MTTPLEHAVKAAWEQHRQHAREDYCSTELPAWDDLEALAKEEWREKIKAAIDAYEQARLASLPADRVERVAKAIGDVWDCPEEDEDRLRVYARAAIAALGPEEVSEEEAAEALYHVKCPSRWKGQWQSETGSVRARYNRQIRKLLDAGFRIVKGGA